MVKQTMGKAAITKVIMTNAKTNAINAMLDKVQIQLKAKTSSNERYNAVYLGLYI